MDKENGQKKIIGLGDVETIPFIVDIGSLLLNEGHTELDTTAEIADRTYDILYSWHRILRLAEKEGHEEGTLQDFIEHVFQKNYLLELFLDKVLTYPAMDPVTIKMQSQLEVLDLQHERKINQEGEK